MSDHDHLSPEPLESYRDFNEQNTEQEKQDTTLTPEEQFRIEKLDVAGPFRKIDMEWQKKQLEKPIQEKILTPDGTDYSYIKREERSFATKQIAYREKVLEFNRDKAKSAFTISHEGKKLDLDR